MYNWIYALEMLGTAVFAISGALAASRARMDIFGFSFVALMPAVGGGTVRDLVLGRVPVFWVNDINYVLVAIAAAILVFLFADRPGHRRQILVWMDAIGLALFAVLGTEVALQIGTNSLIAVTMGVVTAVTGGMIRDIICNEIPLVLTKEIYATAAIAASLIFVIALGNGVDREWALGIGVMLGFLIRGVGIRYGLSLPSFQERK
jgi:uncharacterized membrane protein YeiH